MVANAYHISAPLYITGDRQTRATFLLDVRLLLPVLNFKDAVMVDKVVTPGAEAAADTAAAADQSLW